jgi:hypothetical protein
MAITGLYGYENDTVAAGALAASLTDSATTVDVTDAAAVGVGDLLWVDDEMLVVTGRALVDTTVNTTAALDDLDSVTSVPVGSAAGFRTGEVITIDAEQMLVVDIAGNTLLVRRGFGGSTLADHSSGADVYASRRLTVERGALGTSAAAHSSAAAVLRWRPPAAISALTRGLAIAQFQAEGTGYAGTSGEGAGSRVTAAQLDALWLAADTLRRRRIGAV